MNVAIIVAAGKGNRLGGTQPKQFQELNGTKIIFHTLRPFEQCETISEVILVLPAEATAGFESLAQSHGLKKRTRIVCGGGTRAQSVLNGLNAIKAAEIVAVHDGVRPFVTAAEIDRVVRAAEQTGAAIIVARAIDTIKEVSGEFIVRTVERSRLRRALTPQCFRFDILKRAYAGLSQAELDEIDATDDSVLVERLGVKVSVVEGSARNIKITEPEDLVLAQAILEGR
jgi:2-C-methyl-D-erythritol 4-phosphate cytidylyltransferase